MTIGRKYEERLRVKDVLAITTVLALLITRDYRLQVEQVSRGKYVLALWARSENIIEFLNLGASIATVKLSEAGVVTSGASGVSIAQKPPHPNGAVVFLNWLFREGQTINSQTLNQPSFRRDVPPPEGLRAEALLPPGEKPFWDTEETILMRPKLMGDAGAILRALMN